MGLGPKRLQGTQQIEEIKLADCKRRSPSGGGAEESAYRGGGEKGGRGMETGVEGGVGFEYVEGAKVHGLIRKPARSSNQPMAPPSTQHPPRYPHLSHPLSQPMA